jgi:hypothetical protein
MGTDKEKKPGGGTLVHPDVSGPTGIPGKSTLVGQKPATGAAAIGNAFIEGREHCAKDGDQGCFLNPVQRERLILEIKAEIRQSETFFVQALTEIGFQRLIQKDEELPAIISLALDIAGSYFGGLAVKAMRALRSTPPETFYKSHEGMLSFQTGTNAEPDPSLFRNVLNEASPESVDYVIKTAMSAGKRKAEKGGGDEMNADASNRKQVTLNYLDELKASAAISYEQLAQDAPGVANDAERIAMFESFKAKNGHNVPAFVAVLKEKLDRYLKSPASEIGRNGHRLRDGASKKDSYNATIRDTQVAWVVIAGDPVPKLYYLREDWANNSGSSAGTGAPGDMDKPENERPKSMQGMLTLLRPVEPEFQSSALARPQQVWGFPPTTRYRSREELAAETGDMSVLMIPRLDLTPAHRKLPPPGPRQGPDPLPPLGPVQGPQPEPNQAAAPVSAVPNLIPGGNS